MNDKGVLYIVATPIGNLDDITQRAISTLQKADFIAAEDTRHSQRLLQHFGIQAKLMAYHDHSSDKQLDRLIGLLLEGKSIALISDAGTPLISDPGYRIVRSARTLDIQVVPIPGVSAPITALSAAGLATDRFSFEGFLPHKSSARRKAFESIEKSNGTSVFFESPHRIKDAIDDALAILGAERSAVLARELTKTFETFLGSSLEDIRQAIESDDNQRKGEMVLMIGQGASSKSSSDDLDAETERVLSILAAELPTKQAATLASAISGAPKKKLYERAVQLRDSE